MIDAKPCRGYSTTISTRLKPRTASIAAEPVSPDVPTSSVRRSRRRPRRCSRTRPSTAIPRSLNASVGPCHSSPTKVIGALSAAAPLRATTSTTSSLPKAPKASRTIESTSAGVRSASPGVVNSLSTSAHSALYGRAAQRDSSERETCGGFAGQNMPPSGAQPRSVASESGTCARLGRASVTETKPSDISDREESNFRIDPRV